MNNELRVGAPLYVLVAIEMTQPPDCLQVLQVSNGLKTFSVLLTQSNTSVASRCIGEGM